jgi:hypothetical protein
MDLADPDFPALAQAWALIGAAEIDGWPARMDSGSEGRVADLASVMLKTIQEQSRVIAQMCFRLGSLGQ